jgi:hypothetical protein
MMLLVIGTVVTFALTDEQYNLAYKSGYMDGYTAGAKGRTAHSSSNGYKANAKAATKYGQSDKDKEIVASKDAYKAGYSQGWDDKAAGKENRFL